MTRLIAAAALLLAMPATAPAASRIMVDPRVELLGVVQHLAQDVRVKAADAAYGDRVDKRFGAFRGHAAVRLYRRLAARPGGEGAGILMLYYSAPPALRLERGELSLPYLQSEEEKQLAHRFIWELRAFAEASDFSRFFREHRDYYRGIERAASAELRGLDPAAEIEKYLRVRLDCLNHYILSPLYRPGILNSFILPYPDPATVTEPLSRPIEVYTLLRWVAAKPKRTGASPVFDVPSSVLWQEPLYVFIDPSFHHYEARHIPEPEKFYGALSSCRGRAINCVKGYTVSALAAHLSASVWGGAPRPDATDETHRLYADALSERLKEFESGTGTLWRFYPRLFDVFAGLSGQPRPSRPAPGADPDVSSAAEFLDPRWRRAFAEAR